MFRGVEGGRRGRGGRRLGVGSGCSRCIRKDWRWGDERRRGEEEADGEDGGVTELQGCGDEEKEEERKEVAYIAHEATRINGGRTKEDNNVTTQCTMKLNYPSPNVTYLGPAFKHGA